VALRDRLLQKFRAHGTFVFSAHGSSVSAGHDNFPNQSWPFELERLLRPTFKDLGFDLEVRQRAAGGYGEAPFHAGCLASRAGEGVDVLSWEWFMFHDPACECKMFLAEAAAMKSSPMVFAFEWAAVKYALGGRKGDVYARSMGKKNCEEVRGDARKAVLRNKGDSHFGRWKPNEWYFTEEFASGAEAEEFVKNASDCGRAPPEKEMPPAGRAMNWLHQTGVARPWEKAGHAMYTVSIGAATKHVLRFPWYVAREKVFNVNWHPGPLGHTLIASSIAHFLLTNLQSALAHKRRMGPSSDNPLVGKDVIGQLPEPRCGGLKPRHCKTGMLPTTEGSILSSARDPSSRDTWLFEGSRNAGPVGSQIDDRMVFKGTMASGELKLSFQADSDGQYVILCGAPCGWRCKGNNGWVSSKSQKWWQWKKERTEKRANVSDLTFSIDGRVVSGEELHRLQDELFAGNGKFCPGCEPMASLCQPVAKVAKGRHIVGARVENRSREAIVPKRQPLPTAMRPGQVMEVEILEMLVVG
jgi:hypothetical protein